MEIASKIKRYQLGYYLKVYDVKTGRPRGYVLSQDGDKFRLISTTPLLTHSVFRFQIRVPSEIGDSNKVSFEVLSTWCRPEHGSFVTGFEIITKSPNYEEYREMLRDYFMFRGLEFDRGWNQ